MRERWQGCEIESLPGLEGIVREELAALMPGRAEVTGTIRPGRLAIKLRGQPWHLERLRSAVAVHLLARFDVPRPKALLGHQHLTRLSALLRQLVDRQPRGTFSALRISAAGAESPVFMRLKQELQRGLELGDTGGDGDLLVSFRRPAEQSLGWEVVARTTPRPLSARAWRVRSMPGALNATVAHAMIRLANPQPTDRFVNLACGSGTLLVERLDYVPASVALGVDSSAAALECARANLLASGHGPEGGLVQGDVRQLPLESGTVDTMVVDLPFGMLVGSSIENRQLYPALLREAARVAAPDAALVTITAARRLLDSALREVSPAWRSTQTLEVQVPFRDRTMAVRVDLLRRG